MPVASGIQTKYPSVVPPESNAPHYIVRYYPFNSGPQPAQPHVREHQESYAMSWDEAQKIALELVHNGTALARDVVIFENKHVQIDINVLPPPPSASNRMA